jgi:hypothetical protein
MGLEAMVSAVLAAIFWILLIAAAEQAGNLTVGTGEPAT